MLSAVIIVVLLFQTQPSVTVPMDEFYPYGDVEGDSQLAPNDDGSSGELSISIQFPFFDNYHDSLYVNTNGVISFLVQVSQYTPDVFPLADNRRLVAPFWADVDTRKGGEVYYRETSDSDILQRATSDIRRAFVGQKQFKASWLYVVTWDKVAFFGSEPPFTNKRNTFQAVLVTDGLLSFVIYNYNQITWTTGTASDGNEEGLGGTPAQAGFNAGDGFRFFNIPGSRTSDVLSLTQTTNVAKAGQWVFRIDNAKIEAGGCTEKATFLRIFPQIGPMLGGTKLSVSGPCYNEHDAIAVKFDEDTIISGSFVNELVATITVPVLNKTGTLLIQLSVDGGNSFKFNGAFTSVPINRNEPRVTRINPNGWTDSSVLGISWDSRDLGDQDHYITVELVRYTKKKDTVQLHSFYTVVESQQNTGNSQFTVPSGQGDNDIVGDGRFITLVRVSNIEGGNATKSALDWIWSDVFTWNNTALGDERCLDWYEQEPDPQIFRDDSTLPPCPRTLRQARADRGRFISDEYCSFTNRRDCELYHKEAVQCLRSMNPSNKGAGQRCCYNEQGNLLFGAPIAGSLNRVHPNAGLPVLSNYFHDKVPYQDCCLQSDNCDKYYERRPSDDSSAYDPPQPATGFGDPHMVTLDGVEYTFNGYGEFTVLKIENTNFTLQGRMEPLTNDDSSVSRATVYTAFVSKENGSDIVQVHLNGRGMVDVLVNGRQVEFNEESMFDFQGVSVIHSPNTSTFDVIFKSGVSVTVEGRQELVGLQLLVPKAYKGNTSGLLGYWDGSKETEFQLPDGSFLSTSSNPSVLHHDFGLKWLITEDQSLFTYEEGKSYSSHLDVDYNPVFLDPNNLNFEDAVLEKDAKEACGSSMQCLFDILTTGKITVGIASRQSIDTFVAVVNETEEVGCIPINPKLPNGKMQRNDSEVGISYTFSCLPGYYLNGSHVISCEDGKWNGTPSDCLPVECPPVDWLILHGRSSGNGSTFGAHYEFSCDAGYTLFGDNQTHCTPMAQWSSMRPRCMPDCPNVAPALKNGRVQGSGSTFGSCLVFSCDVGYTLLGDENICCTEKGSWNETKPECMKDCPNMDSSLKNGRVQENGLTFGSCLVFSCDTGYALVGDENICCIENGAWSGTKPECMKDCPNMDSSLRNGQVRGNGSTFGSCLVFSCDVGYTLVGDENICCTENGTWNGTKPECNKDHVIIAQTSKTTLGAYVGGSVGVLLALVLVLLLVWFLFARYRGGRNKKKQRKLVAKTELQLEPILV